MPDAVNPGELTPEKPPKVQLVKGQEVSLGCGTLILIAIIVGMFGGRGVDNLEREVRGLRSEVGELTKAVETQTRQIEALQEKVEKAKGKQ